jgi:hypothetical protein
VINSNAFFDAWSTQYRAHLQTDRCSQDRSSSVI